MLSRTRDFNLTYFPLSGCHATTCNRKLSLRQIDSAKKNLENSNLKLPTAVIHLVSIAGWPAKPNGRWDSNFIFFVNASSWANAACTKLSIEHNIMMIRYWQVDQAARRPLGRPDRAWFFWNVFNDHNSNFVFFVNASSWADPPQAKLSIGCLFAYPGQRTRCVAHSSHVTAFEPSKSSGGSRLGKPSRN